MARRVIEWTVGIILVGIILVLVVLISVKIVQDRKLPSPTVIVHVQPDILKPNGDVLNFPPLPDQTIHIRAIITPVFQKFTPPKFDTKPIEIPVDLVIGIKGPNLPSLPEFKPPSLPSLPGPGGLPSLPPELARLAKCLHAAPSELIVCLHATT